MAEAKNCPKCGLVNPPSAQRCDCGYDFVSRSVEQSYLNSTGVRRGGSRLMGCGCLALAPFLMCSGLMTVGQVAGQAGAGSPEALGAMSAALLMSVAALTVGVYQLRQSREHRR